jgi:hydroxyacylglutathione hydrolase
MGEAVRDLAYIGIDKVAGYWADTAVDEWRQSGRAAQYYGVIPATEVADRIFKGEMKVVDVRAQTEWDEGHLPGATHIMLGYLAERADEIVDEGKPVVVQCRTGNRSAIGASILQAKGAAEVFNLADGIRGWAKAGLPIEK